MLAMVLFAGALVGADATQAAEEYSAKPPSSHTIDALRAPIEASDDDRRDDDFSMRGFIATRADPLIRDAWGEIVRDLRGYDWLRTDESGSVNPSLRRNARMLTRHGLFKVTDGVFQVRGFDASNMTIVAGQTGYIVIDPLMTSETARAAMDLVYAQLGRRAVLAVVYSHTHPDHYGGIRGIVDEADVQAGKVAIIAPDQFMEEVASESVLAGPAMSRRILFHSGRTLEPGPRGTVGIGVGFGGTKGSITLIAPTDLVKKTGDIRKIDGVVLEFQMVPESEAPAELNVFLPEQRTLLVSEMASCSLHNIQTLRGAPPRDALKWSKYLDEALQLYALRADIVIGSHCWPRFGHSEVNDFLSKQRNIYKYIHDQTVRLMNLGGTPTEIADAISPPEALTSEWYNRGYYGTVSHNSKAIYARYLGWFDGVPANLDPLPPINAAKRYVELAGGSSRMLAAGRSAAANGDYRWAAELLQRLVFADPLDEDARLALADTYEQLGYQSESGLWRNFYLVGASDLRKGPAARFASASVDVRAALPTTDYLDILATRLTPEKIGDRQFSINLSITDRNEVATLLVEDAVVIPRFGTIAPGANATITATWPVFLKLFSSDEPMTDITKNADLKIAGDATAVEAFREALTTFSADFSIVTP